MADKTWQVAIMAERSTIKILIVDDHVLFRQYLRMALSSVPGIEIIGKAENGQFAIEKVCHLRPDMVIMDIHMPVLDGIEATRRIKAQFPNIAIIAFSSETDAYLVHEMMDAGASDYLLKSVWIDHIERSIRNWSASGEND